MSDQARNARCCQQCVGGAALCIVCMDKCGECVWNCGYFRERALTHTHTYALIGGNSSRGFWFLGNETSSTVRHKQAADCNALLQCAMSNHEPTCARKYVKKGFVSVCVCVFLFRWMNGSAREVVHADKAAWNKKFWATQRHCVRYDCGFLSKHDLRYIFTFQ